MRLLQVLLMLVLAGPAFGGGSSPVLTLTAADVAASAAGVVSIDARGSFNFEDVVEGVFVAGLVVHQGTHFVRFDQAGATAEGDGAFLSNGLVAGEAPALAGLGSPAPAPAALVQLRVDRVSVVLPAGFAAGPATVALYAVYDGEGFASNPITVTLP